MFSKNTEDLIYKMTNFYQDHLPSDSSFEKLLTVYSKVIGSVWDEYRFVKSNTFVQDAKTLYTIPYFKLDVSEGIYDTSRALQLKMLSFDDCIRELDKDRKYITLSFEKDTARQSVVFSMELRTTFASLDNLQLYTHYFLRANRLYLLPDFILNYERIKQYLHGFNIKVNNQNLERNWGSMLDISTGPLLPRFQYQNVLSSFGRVLKGDLTIKSISEGIATATEWSTFKVEDKHSPNLSYAKRRMYEELMISPARFLVSLPESLIKDKMRFNLLLSLLDEAKQSHTNYLVMFDIIRNDIISIPDLDRRMISMGQRDLYTSSDFHGRFLSMELVDYLFDYMGRYDSSHSFDLDSFAFDERYKQDFYYPTLTMPFIDSGTLGDSNETPSVSMRVGESMTFENQTIPYFDENFSYDDEIEYDMVQSNMFDSQASFDTPKLYQADRFMIKLIDFPEIPRLFEASAEGTPGVYLFTCRPNNDGTTKIELYGTSSEEEIYELLESQTNEESLEKITFVHDANTSGKRYYKIRAVAGSSISFMTLPIDIQSI